MQLIAGSLEQAADTFLHAGYISAYPRTLGAHAVDFSSIPLKVDTAQALKLAQDGAVAPAASTDGVGSAVALLSNWGSLPLMVFGVVSFTACLAVLYYARSRWGPRVGWGSFAVGIALSLAFACGKGMTSQGSALPTQSPWEKVELRAYQDPQAATHVLLHGIVADALTNIGQPVSDLANLQNEVGLPSTQLSEGEAYALQTYSIDGWGRPFRLAVAAPQYTVTSAGPDGAFDTPDDVSMTVTQCTDSDWDSSRHVFFLRKHEDKVVVLFHRWTGEHFKYADQTLATQLSGNGLFDALDASAFRENAEKLLNAYETAAAQTSGSPVVMISTHSL